jgi:cell wall-associated NlpC family hydrolase
MKKIGFFGIVFFAALVSCNVGKRNQAEQIIKSFEEKNVPDKREVVFEIEAVFEKGKLVLTGEISDLNLKNHLSDRLKNVRYTDNISVLPDSTVGNQPFALVNVPVANFRAQPKYSSELVTQAILGTPIIILKKTTGWYLVQTPDNYISWADAGALYLFSEEEFNRWRKSDRLIFNTLNGTVYETENLQNPVADVTLGCIVQKTEQNRQWAKVLFPDGRSGFVNPEKWINFSEFKSSVQPVPEDILWRAKQLTGRSYLWGGTTANSMDCSGFVKTVYFMNGIILARDASLQTRHGQPVFVSADYQSLQPGDLLFFGRKATETEKERVTHVALSLGGTEFIHASGWVKQNSFDPSSEFFSEYRKNSFIRAKRVINTDYTEIQILNEHPLY